MLWFLCIKNMQIHRWVSPLMPCMVLGLIQHGFVVTDIECFRKVQYGNIDLGLLVMV